MAAGKQQNVTVLQSDASSNTALEGLFGAITVSAFIIIWLASAVSPFLFLYACWNGNAIAASAIAVITVFAYLPWEHGPLSQRVQNFIDGHHASYYDGVSIVFEGEKYHLPSIGKPSSPSTLMVPSVLGGPCCSLVQSCTVCASALPQRSICHPSFAYFLGQLESQDRRHDRQ